MRFAGVSCIQITTRRCHIAVPGDPPNVRRMCLIPDRDVDSMFAGVTSPFNCSEDVNKQEVWGTLLWEVEMLNTDRTAINFPPVAADIPDDLPHGMEFQTVDLSLPYVDRFFFTGANLLADSSGRKLRIADFGLATKLTGTGELEA
ncbi:hypothetical protein Bbelb_109180 [Branchiostoma belcheri]|nr:hypothetical protein Bbelb_109180 [Branchiostoma belcheri]